MFGSSLEGGKKREGQRDCRTFQGENGKLLFYIFVSGGHLLSLRKEGAATQVERGEVRELV